MPELVLNFDNIDRNLATHALDQNTARVLDRVDTNMFPGRMVRGRGASGTQVSPSAATVTSAYVFRRGDCKRVLVDGSTAGTVRITPGALNKCYGPLPEWDDRAPVGGAVDPTAFGSGVFGTGLSDPSWAYVRFVAVLSGGVASTAKGLGVHADGVFFGSTDPWVGTVNSSTYVREIGDAAGNTSSGIPAYMFADPTGTAAYGWFGSIAGGWVFASGLGSYTVTVYWTNVSSSDQLIGLDTITPGQTSVRTLSNGGTILAL